MNEIPKIGPVKHNAVSVNNKLLKNLFINKRNKCRKNIKMTKYKRHFNTTLLYLLIRVILYTNSDTFTDNIVPNKTNATVHTKLTKNVKTPNI